MKYILTLCLLFVIVITKANDNRDTIAYWHISYGKQVAIKGNVNMKQAPVREITVRPDVVKDLTISFVYDNGQLAESTLVVKERNEVLGKIPHDPIMGSYFVVSVEQLIGTHQTNVRYELDFYYTDNLGQRNLKLGTIIFIFK